jgi:Asp-tRNA(Asn)/Glu-tRNA(Gln) amidotransferase C subunit
MLSPIGDSRLRLRQDIVNDGNCTNAVLSNAGKTDMGFFVLPAVLDTEEDS